MGVPIIYSPNSYDFLEGELRNAEIALSIEVTSSIKRRKGKKNYRGLESKMEQARCGADALKDIIGKEYPCKALPAIACFDPRKMPGNHFLMLTIHGHDSSVLQEAAGKAYWNMKHEGHKNAPLRELLGRIIDTADQENSSLRQLLYSNQPSPLSLQYQDDPRYTGWRVGVQGEVNNWYVAELFARNLSSGAVFIRSGIKPSKSESGRLRVQGKKLPSTSDLDVAIVTTKEALNKAGEQLKRQGLISSNRDQLIN